MKPLIIVKSYRASLTDVWNAITVKDQMKLWYFDIPDFELKVGKEFNFFEPGDKNEFHHRCEIREIIPNQRLQYTWTYPKLSEGESLVSWDLTPYVTRTTVRLRHDFIESFADGGNVFARENFEVGWREILGKSLKTYLDKQTKG